MFTVYLLSGSSCPSPSSPFLSMSNVVMFLSCKMRIIEIGKVTACSCKEFIHALLATYFPLKKVKVSLVNGNGRVAAS